MLPSENRRAICDVTIPEASPGPEESDIVTAHARWEYLKAIYDRYRQATRPEKRQILDECCRVTGYHRKHAVRLLNGPALSGDPSRARRRRLPTYGLAVIEALRTIWEAAGYPWSVRLKALLPLWLPQARRRLQLSPAVERHLLAISPRQPLRPAELVTWDVPPHPFAPSRPRGNALGRGHFAASRPRRRAEPRVRLH